MCRASIFHKFLCKVSLFSSDSCPFSLMDTMSLSANVPYFHHEKSMKADNATLQTNWLSIGPAKEFIAEGG